VAGHTIAASILTSQAQHRTVGLLGMSCRSASLTASSFARRAQAEFLSQCVRCILCIGLSDLGRPTEPEDAGWVGFWT
jgi:hypothetical protein